MPEIISEITTLQDEAAWFTGLGPLSAHTRVPKVTECAPGVQGGRNPSLVRETQAAYL